jgi:hypothetical protein
MDGESLGVGVVSSDSHKQYHTAEFQSWVFHMIRIPNQLLRRLMAVN